MAPMRYRCYSCGYLTPYYAAAQRHAYTEGHARICMSPTELGTQVVASQTPVVA